MDSLKDLICKAKEKRDEYQRILGNLIEAQKVLGDESESIPDLSEFKKNPHPKRKVRVRVRPSDERIIRRILSENLEPMKTDQIKEAMTKQGRIITKNALSSRLSSLVRGGNIARIDRGLYTMPDRVNMYQQ